MYGRRLKWDNERWILSQHIAYCVKVSKINVNLKKIKSLKNYCMAIIKKFRRILRLWIRNKLRLLKLTVPKKNSEHKWHSILEHVFHIKTEKSFKMFQTHKCSFIVSQSVMQAKGQGCVSWPLPLGLNCQLTMS